MVESTAEIRALDNAKLALKTYSNYIKAWVTCISSTYGSGDDGKNRFKQEIKSLVSFSRIQGGASTSVESVNNYNRGRLTLKAMREFPIDSYPELAISANLWLPVQSYYAIRGVGLATMLTLGRGSPQGHESFRADFSELVSRHFPYPLCGRCAGGPNKSYFSFLNLHTSVDKATEQNQLVNLITTEQVENIIGKSLKTTREKILDYNFTKMRSDKRKKQGKKNLSSAEIQGCCQNQHATSICDLIYRMRIKSNYYSPDMYLFGSNSVDDAANHYGNLRYLTEIIIAGLETLMEKSIGQTEMANLRSIFQEQSTP